MLTGRVAGSGSAAASDVLRSHTAELLSVYPPPRSPKAPATAGRARTAAAADPPLRFRSSPQPQRMTAGRVSA